MNMGEIDAALSAVNAKIDAMKSEARNLARARDKVIAEEKIASMSQAEKDALLALLKDK